MSMQDLKDRMAKRPYKCFGTCNLHSADDKGKKFCKESEEDKCPSFDDCFLITPVLNKGYDPSKPESADNAVGFSYKTQTPEHKLKIEQTLEKMKATKSEKATRERSKEKAVEKPAKEKETRASRSKPEDDLLGDIGNQLEGLDDAGKDAVTVTSEAGLPELDDLTQAVEGKKAIAEQENAIETAASQQVDQQAEVMVNRLAGPASQELINGIIDVEVVKGLIRYAAQEFAAAFGMVAKRTKVDKTVEKEKVAPALTAAGTVPKKRGPKPGSKRKPKNSRSR